MFLLFKYIVKCFFSFVKYSFTLFLAKIIYFRLSTHFFMLCCVRYLIIYNCTLYYIGVTTVMLLGGSGGKLYSDDITVNINVYCS